jgi:hypothetical protein
MRKTRLVFVGTFCLLACGYSAAQQQTQQQPQLQEEVIVRWWLVPVYAVDKAGAPVLNLAPEDFEVYIKGIKVDPFTLHKKEFKVSETKARVTETPVSKAPLQKKMVFLVFDALFSPYNLLAKAKTIADEVIAQSDMSAQYVLLSIEPMAGLHYVCGPTQDLKLLARDMKKYIVGKKQDYMMKTSELDRSSIRLINPGNQDGARVVNYMYQRDQQFQDVSSRTDYRDKKRMAAVYSQALMTLNLVLGYFREYSKVVYLYSCGIPASALVDRQELNKDFEGASWEVYLSPDTFEYDTLTLLGRYFNKSGALLFLVNPAGTRVSESDADSGEASLRMLASESGGRYYEGAEKQIAQEVNNMEGGYYEISFADKPEYAGDELDFEIRPKKPDITVFTVKKVGREKSYSEMTDLEKEVLVLNVLNNGPYALTKQKVVFVEGQAYQDGGSLVCSIRLPADLPRTGYTIFKVARNFETGDIRIDQEAIVPESPAVEVQMKWRGKAYRHDIVVANSKTGTILVWK